MSHAQVTSMGIPLDDLDPTAGPGTHSLFGAPGAGKSSQVALAFPNSFYVQSQPDLLHYAYVLHKASPNIMPKVPRPATLDESTVRGYCTPGVNDLMPFTTAITEVLNRFITACDRGVFEFDAIVFDEWSTFFERVFQEIKLDPYQRLRGKNGKVDDFAVMREAKKFHSAVLAAGRRTRKSMVLVSHYQDTRWFDDPNHHFFGNVKTLRGPKVPQGLGDALVQISAESSSCVELTAKASKPASMMSMLGLPPPALTPAAPNAMSLLLGTTGAPATAAPATSTAPEDVRLDPGTPRVFLTQLTDKAFRKLRGQPRDEVDCVIGKYSYRDLLLDAGHKIQPAVLPCTCVVCLTGVVPAKRS